MQIPASCPRPIVRWPAYRLRRAGRRSSRSCPRSCDKADRHCASRPWQFASRVPVWDRGRASLSIGHAGRTGRAHGVVVRGKHHDVGSALLHVLGKAGDVSHFVRDIGTGEFGLRHTRNNGGMRSRPLLPVVGIRPSGGAITIAPCVRLVAELERDEARAEYFLDVECFLGSSSMGPRPRLRP